MATHTVQEIVIEGILLKTRQVWGPRGSGHHGSKCKLKVVGFTSRSVVTEVIGWSRGKKDRFWTTPIEKFIRTNELIKSA